MTLPLPAPTVEPVRCRNPLCRRWLRDPESVALGYGRQCAEERGLVAPRRPRWPVVHGEAADDLTLFDLINMKETRMNVQRFRKKPVEVEAVQFTGDNADEIAEFMGGKAKNATLPGPGRGVHKGIRIETLEGTMTASVGDWVIRGVQNEYYPCKPDIFEQTYEPVGQPA